MAKEIQTLSEILCAAAARRRADLIVNTAKTETAERCTRQELADTFAGVLATGASHPRPAVNDIVSQTDPSD